MNIKVNKLTILILTVVFLFIFVRPPLTKIYCQKQASSFEQSLYRDYLQQHKDQLKNDLEQNTNSQTYKWVALPDEQQRLVDNVYASCIHSLGE